MLYWLYPSWIAAIAGGFDFGRRLVCWRALRQVDGIVAQAKLRHATDDRFGKTSGFV